MKKVFVSLVLLAVAVVLSVASCDNFFEGGDFRVKSFTSSGCTSTKSYSNDVIAKDSNTNGKLRIVHSDGCLEVSLCDFTTGCQIKDGFNCNAFLEGNTISVNVECKTDGSANCICTLDKVETVLSGLKEGRYTLIYHYYDCDNNISKKVDFEYNATLHKSVDFVTYNIIYQ